MTKRKSKETRVAKGMSENQHDGREVRQEVGLLPVPYDCRNI